MRVVAILRMNRIAGRRHAIGERTRTYQQSYYVLTDSPAADPAELRALVAAAVPVAWPTDPASRRSGLELSQMREQRAAWEVEVSYSLQGEGDSEDPFGRRRELSFTWSRSTRTIANDVHGQPMLNTALQPMLLEEDDVRQEIRLKWAARGVSPAVAGEYAAAVNADYWSGLEPWRARCVGLAGEEMLTPSGVPYVVLSATIEVHARDWRRRVLNRGTHTIVRVDGVPQKHLNGHLMRNPIVDDQGNVVEELLNEDGTAVLAPGAPPIELEFETLRALPFGAFFPSS